LETGTEKVFGFGIKVFVSGRYMEKNHYIYRRNVLNLNDLTPKALFLRKIAINNPIIKHGTKNWKNPGS